MSVCGRSAWQRWRTKMTGRQMKPIIFKYRRKWQRSVRVLLWRSLTVKYLLEKKQNNIIVGACGAEMEGKKERERERDGKTWGGGKGRRILSECFYFYSLLALTVTQFTPPLSLHPSQKESLCFQGNHLPSLPDNAPPPPSKTPKPHTTVTSPCTSPNCRCSDDHGVAATQGVWDEGGGWWRRGRQKGQRQGEKMKGEVNKMDWWGG